MLSVKQGGIKYHFLHSISRISVIFFKSFLSIPFTEQLHKNPKKYISTIALIAILVIGGRREYKGMVNYSELKLIFECKYYIYMFV